MHNQDQMTSRTRFNSLCKRFPWIVQRPAMRGVHFGKLLFDTTVHEKSSSAFHRMCDWNGPTLTLATVKDGRSSESSAHGVPLLSAFASTHWTSHEPKNKCNATQDDYINISGCFLCLESGVFVGRDTWNMHDDARIGPTFGPHIFCPLNGADCDFGEHQDSYPGFKPSMHAMQLFHNSIGDGGPDILVFRAVTLERIYCCLHARSFISEDFASRLRLDVAVDSSYHVEIDCRFEREPQNPPDELRDGVPKVQLTLDSKSRKLHISGSSLTGEQKAAVISASLSALALASALNTAPGLNSPEFAWPALQAAEPSDDDGEFVSRAPTTARLPCLQLDRSVGISVEYVESFATGTGRRGVTSCESSHRDDCTPPASRSIARYCISGQSSEGVVLTCPAYCGFANTQVLESVPACFHDPGLAFLALVIQDTLKHRRHDPTAGNDDQDSVLLGAYCKYKWSFQENQSAMRTLRVTMGRKAAIEDDDGTPMQPLDRSHRHDSCVRVSYSLKTRSNVRVHNPYSGTNPWVTLTKERHMS